MVRGALAAPLAGTSRTITSGKAVAAERIADHDVALALRGRTGVPAGEVVAVRRESLGLAATGDRHAPQLHRAVDRGREQDVDPVRGGRDGRLAADRHVAVHRGIRLELAAGQEVRAATGAGIGAVRGEAPDARPVAGSREPLAQGEDRGAITGPGGVREGRVGTTGDRGHVARRHVHDVDPGPPAEVRVATPVRGEGDPGAIRGPRRPGLRRRAAHECPGRTGGDVHEPQVALPIVHEPGTVVLVAQPIDVAVVRQRRLAGLGLGRASPAPLVLGGRGPQGACQDRELGAVR